MRLKVKGKVKLKLKAKVTPAPEQKKKAEEFEWWYVDDRNKKLLEPELMTRGEKVVQILHMARCREFTEYNHKLHFHVTTRFSACAFNLAFFDLDKESTAMPWRPIRSVPLPRHHWLADSVNVVAVKVAASDVGYPVSVFGTVLARDEYDYRCVYLFRRGSDDPQLITSPEDTLTLTRPYRALAVSDSMYFEFHLKIKRRGGGGGGDGEDFSKGVVEHSGVCHTGRLKVQSFCSHLSTVELVYTPVPCAVEASVAVSVVSRRRRRPSSDGSRRFAGKLTARTTWNEENEVVLYDSVAAAGARTTTVVGDDGGSSVVPLACGVVAVPLDDDLLLRVDVRASDDDDDGRDGGCGGGHGERFELVIGQEVEECVCEQGDYEVRVKVSWKGVMNRRGPSSLGWGRPGMWGRVGQIRVLL